MRILFQRHLRPFISARKNAARVLLDVNSICVAWVMLHEIISSSSVGRLYILMLGESKPQAGAGSTVCVDFHSTLNLAQTFLLSIHSIPRTPGAPYVALHSSLHFEPLPHTLKLCMHNYGTGTNVHEQHIIFVEKVRMCVYSPIECSTQVVHH